MQDYTYTHSIYLKFFWMQQLFQQRELNQSLELSLLLLGQGKCSCIDF